MKWTVVDIGTRARTQLLELSRTSLLPNCSRPKLSPASFGIKTHDYKPLEVPDNTPCRACGSPWTHYVEKPDPGAEAAAKRPVAALPCLQALLRCSEAEGPGVGHHPARAFFNGIRLG